MRSLDRNYVFDISGPYKYWIAICPGIAGATAAIALPLTMFLKLLNVLHIRCSLRGANVSFYGLFADVVV